MSDEKRNDQMIRCFHVVNFLSSSRFPKTIKDILAHLTAQGLTVHERTVRRDIDALKSVFLPLQESKDKNNATAWRLDADVSPGYAAIVTKQALLGLYLMNGLSQSMDQTTFQTDIEAFFRSVDSRLGEKAREHVNDMKAVTHFSDKKRWLSKVDKSIFETIQNACMEGHVIEGAYESVNSGLKTRRLGPHGLYFEAGSIYLLAEDLDAGQVKTFVVSRFQSAAMLDVEYRADRLSPDILFRNSFGVYRGIQIEKVALEFDKELAPFVSETEWHPSQTISRLDAGKLLLELELSITPDFVNWVLGFGEKVTIRSPELLQNQVREIARVLLSRYKPKQAV
jgi:predicted DNA-binding transcriptional regulator YafY